MHENSQPKIFVIVLNFNGKNTLAACLSSIYQSDYLNFEVVVVDNDSRDGSLEQARESFSRAHFIKNSVNMGFSRGNNVGIRLALEKFADYVFILNNDTLIEKTTLSSLANTLEAFPSAGIASPVIFTADSKHIWFAGGLIYWQKMKTDHLYQEKSDKPYSTEYISGCAMFVRKDVFKKIGLFDERFFLYYEDADFSVRAKKAGIDLLMVPSAHIEHLEQSNAENRLKTYWLVLSGLMFFQANASFFQKIWIFIYIRIRKIKNLYDLIFSRNEVALSVHKAYRDFKKAYKK
jgi:GT2 family glycosyltransferase